MDTETSDIENAVQASEFAFLVIKQKDGRLAIAHVNNEQTERQPTLDDVFSAITTLGKDLERQALVAAILQGIQQTGIANGAQSPSGLVVPEKKFVKRQ